MSRLILICCAFATIATIGLSYAAPLENFSSSASLSKQEFVERFVEFLRQDTELSGALNKDFNGGSLARHRRADDDIEGIIDDAVLDQDTNKEGFFDRAAKFVMEVLQRFLRWVNTDDN